VTQISNSFKKTLNWILIEVQLLQHHMQCIVQTEMNNKRYKE